MKNMRFIFIFSIILVLTISEKLHATDYYLAAGGNPTVLANWGTNTDGTGTAPSTFTLSSDLWWVVNNTSVNLTGSWNVSGGTQVIIGDGVSSTTLVITGSGTLTNNTPIICNVDGVLDIENNYAYSITNVDGSLGTVILGTGANDIPAGMSFLNLVIGDAITFAQVTVNGTLTINSGRTLTFDNTGILSLTAAHIAGAGEIDGGTAATAAVVSVNGTGGTLRTTAGSRLKTLTLNLSNNTDVLALGSDLRLDFSSPAFNLTRGILDLGAHSFTNNGATALTANGSISGTSTSTIQIGGTSLTSLTGSMLMTSTSNTLGALIMNRSTKTLTLGNTLNVTSIINPIAGTIASGGNLNMVPLAGTSATIGATGSAGSITGNYSVTGTSTSTLEIVTIGGLSGSLFTASGSSSLSALNLNSTGKTVTLGNTLNILDFITVTDGTVAAGGNLNLVASNGRVGSVGTMGATGAISGNAIVNTFVDGLATDWTLIGVPGVTGKTINDLQGQIFMTCNNCNILPSAAGNFTSVQGWIETSSTYDGNLTTTSSYTPGLGYWAYLGNAAPGANSTPFNMSYTGPLAQGTFSLRTSFAGTGGAGISGYNLLANPYASPISWASVYAANSAVFFGNTAYFYGRGSGATAVQDDGTTSGAGNMGVDIPAGQGFFVERIGGGTGNRNLFISESNKSTVNTVNILRPSANGKTVVNEMNAFRIKLTGAYDWDDAVFKIVPNAELTYGKGDARKMFGLPATFGGQAGVYHRTSISSKDPNGFDIAINAFPASSSNITIPILTKVSISGTYTLHANDFDNYQSCILIKDKLSGVITDLKVKDYVFQISDTTSTPRFELIVCASGNSGPLSVSDFFASSNLSINQDADGVIVRSNFKDNTKSIISVYNIVGQKIIDDVEIEGTQTTHLNLDTKNQVVLIKVVNDKESLTKKIMLH